MTASAPLHYFKDQFLYNKTIINLYNNIELFYQFFNRRCGRNRTHIGGFGDRCPTVERRTYFKELVCRGSRIRTHILLLWRQSCCITPYPYVWVSGRIRTDNTQVLQTWAWTSTASETSCQRTFWSQGGIRTHEYTILRTVALRPLDHLTCGAPWNRTTTSGFSVQRAHLLHQSSMCCLGDRTRTCNLVLPMHARSTNCATPSFCRDDGTRTRIHSVPSGDGYNPITGIHPVIIQRTFVISI